MDLQIHIYCLSDTSYYNDWLIPIIGGETMGNLRVHLMMISVLALIFAVGMAEEQICENIMGQIQRIKRRISER